MNIGASVKIRRGVKDAVQLKLEPSELIFIAKMIKG